MKEAKERLSLRVPKDFKQDLRIAAVKAQRELTDIVIEAVDLWLIDFNKQEAAKKK
jgi:uncharacterized protein (DUF1778 family)